MAEYDDTGLARIVRGALTGRQSAHLKISRRRPQHEREPRNEIQDPEVSVVSWKVHEEICETYRVKLVVTAPAAISRKHILGQIAKFTVEPEDGRGKREWRGYISRFNAVSQSRDLCTYAVTVRQHLASMNGALNCATYQHQASWEIIREIVKRHVEDPLLQVEVKLHRDHPRHAFRFQYNLSDLRFCRLQLEQAGLFWYTKPGKWGDVLVIGDDIDAYIRPAIKVRDRPTSGLHTFEESIHSFRVRTRSVPKGYTVGDFNPDAAWERIRAEQSVESDDITMLGTPSVWGTHHLDEEEAKREARLRHEAAMAHQVRYFIKSTLLDAYPGRTIETDTPHEDARYGVVITRVIHRGARDQSYSNSIRAIPADRPYRMKIDESRWPKIHGTLGATICSPNNYKYAYLTENGEYIARLHCDFGNWPKGGESIPLRLAKPFSGKNHTGMHMPALDGDHALVGFVEANANKPVILAFLPNSTHPDLINSSRRRMSRNEIRTQSGNKLWMEDWTDQEGIELSTEHSGRSQLNLGCIPDHELSPRGAGAELRTAAHLVNRGGAGVMVTAYNQAGGSGKVLAMDETQAQFSDHQAFVKSLAESADASKASPADTDAQKGINDGLKELKQPGVLVTGPGPVAVAAGDGVQLAADGSIIGTAKKGIHFSTLKRMTAAARGVISLFSQAGMKLIAAAGDVVMQAQRGRIQVAGQEGVTIESVNDTVHVKAAKEIILNVNGTYVKLTGEGVEIGSRGGVLYRTTGVKGTGPAQMDLGGAAFAPKFVPYTTDCEVWRINPKFVTPPAPPAPMPSQWQALANTGAVPPAPALDAGSMKSAGGVGQAGGEPLGQPMPQTGRVPQNAGNGVLIFNDPENEPTQCVSPDPIKLESAAPCGWQLGNFSVDKTKLHRETPKYKKNKNRRNDLETDASNNPILCSGTADPTCRFQYDSDSKTLTAKVVIVLKPRLLVERNVGSDTPKLGPDGKYNVVKYESYLNGANSGKSFAEWGLLLLDREVDLEKYAATYKSEIEKTLNQGNYKLVRGGCQKGAACGCRVAVKFCVEIHAVRGIDANSIDADALIDIFPETARADAANWSEVDLGYDSFGALSPQVQQVKAHETGHLFAFPDEYWQNGGFVHAQYVKDDLMLDFTLGDANTLQPNKTWQISSPVNLMGGGCTMRTAVTRPYYFECIRKWFSKYTNREWRVGYIESSSASQTGASSDGKSKITSGGGGTAHKKSSIRK